MSPREFIAIWNCCESLDEFHEMTGIKPHAASVKANAIRRTGLDIKKMPFKKPEGLLVRFWKMVDKETEDGCWKWTGSVNVKGYGQISTTRNSGPIQSHRLSWIIHNGTIPKGMNVLHECDNPSCVNPCHLFIGTSEENTHDMMEKERGWWQRNAPHKSKILNCD